MSHVNSPVATVYFYARSNCMFIYEKHQFVAAHLSLLYKLLFYVEFMFRKKNLKTGLLYNFDK